jgi:hypothetical protein
MTAAKMHRGKTTLIDTDGLARRMVISERVALAFEREPLGRRLMALIPVQITGCGAIGSDGEHLYFDPELVRNLPRHDFKNRLTALAETLGDMPRGSPRESFAPWTGVLVDGVVRRDQPSAQTLEALKKFDVIMSRDAHACGWNYDTEKPPQYLRMVVTGGILRHVDPLD